MQSRRQFMTGIVPGLAGLSLAATPGMTLFSHNAYAMPAAGSNIVIPRANVGYSRSGQDRAVDITYNELAAMIREAVARAGGIGDIVGDGAAVVLKPNMVSYYDESLTSNILPREANGICTDYRVVRAVAELVREFNPHGTVYVVEGAANGTTRLAMEALGYNFELIPGVDKFICLEETSGAWEEWDAKNLVKVTLPDGVGRYPDTLKPNRTKEFYLNRLYYEADVIISLPLLKNHSMANTTGAVKNLGIGGTPQTIYGGAPGDNHRYVNNRINHSSLYLHQWIHDFFLCRPADFSIMEGIQGTSYGPVAEGAVNLVDAQENMRLVMASRDAVAIDSVASFMMNVDPRKVRYLSYLADEGNGFIQPAEIRLDGGFVQDVRKRFRQGPMTDYDVRFTPPAPPSFTIDALYIEDNTLKIKLAPDTAIVKVEVALDGVLLPEYAIGGFDDISFDISTISRRIENVTITVYDSSFGSTRKTVPVTTSVSSRGEHRAEIFTLFQNAPNPFNPETTIPLRLERSGTVRLTVFDAGGRHVRTLVSGWMTAGMHTVRFDGRGLASGQYFCRFECEGMTTTKKMTLVK